MVTREENEILTRTGPGTPMGDALRRYWVPALLSYELPEPDCPPVRVKLLGEDLVAFKDTDGRIGLLEEFCAHRRSSLFLGRNEECGLRCVFHGWKYDVHGNCTDMMNEPPESDFKDKIKLLAYPTLELGDVIWTYMGPKDQIPVQPKFEWTQVPSTHRQVSKNVQDNNWLQGLEGGVDTSHATILHQHLTTETKRAGYALGTEFVNSAPATVEVDPTDYGYRYVGIRAMGERGNFVRSYHFIMPWHQIRPQQFGSMGAPPRPFIAGHMWVPMDDQISMVYNWAFTYGTEPLTEKERAEFEEGKGPDDMLPDFRNIRNRDNDWLMDRQVQKTETFTGIEGINNQDQAVQESMGYIVDRTKENLSTADMAIVHTRRLLLQAARTVADGGDPPALGTSYFTARAFDRVLPVGAAWRDEMLADMYPSPERST